MTQPENIRSPEDSALDQLCCRLSELAPGLAQSGKWPAKQLELCGQAGVFQWFVDPQWGGQGWSDSDIVRGYLRLSAACLTTTFIITQLTGACRRIQVAETDDLKLGLLPNLIAGSQYATLGISHLTTSRRHLAKPVLLAEETKEGFVLEGYIPWVTGGEDAQFIITGAAMEDGRQVLLAMPTDLPGVVVEPGLNLVGLTASRTGPVRCQRVLVERRWLLAGPGEGIMKQGVGAKTGGLQTSTLAVGLADAAISFLEEEAKKRADLTPPTESLRNEFETLQTDLLAISHGNQVCSTEQLRTRANSLALRSSQASLAAAKGAGYVVGHPAGRWCQEALFFLVWSCPQSVMAANLCELSGISE